MVGALRPVIAILVAANAFARRPAEDVVLVAVDARHRSVLTDQRKDTVVIEAGGGAAAPERRIGGTMTCIAGQREPGGGMVGVLGRSVGRLVAADTLARRSLVDVVLVAGLAGLRGVGAD